MNLIEKLENEERLDFDDGVKLYEIDFFTLAKYAKRSREKRWSKKVFFNSNRHLNPTNICQDVCKFCAFSASRKNPNQYTLDYEEMMSIVDNACSNGVKEIHIVSAHNANMSLEWYFDIFKKIKERYPFLHIKALTAAEVHFLVKKHKMSYNELLTKMVEYGVDSMPGGGAEIFDEKVREYICKGKVKSNEWLEIHELWHKRGRYSNATMLFGHIENIEHRIDHMIRIRDVQDRSGGFNAFIPLVYQRENNYLKVEKFLGAKEILQTYAVSRLMLDNIPHIKAYWATSTMNLAVLAQEFGADDMDGTIGKESIQSAAGAKSGHGKELQDFIDVIITSGFIPVLRDSLYNELEIYS
ncbi:MAG: aminofutalosine synthase MqnE [Campylobacteraceae bacterium]|jgi:aminodeoxyfutalosine synthase|nr:aminofutalosine synthase MqnE [Campylobacteraceae bacterium]